MNDLLIKDNETLDDLKLGGMKIIQPKQGYRFAIDAVLIAFFPELQEVRDVVDLGTGSGVIPLLMSYRDHNIKITGVELVDSVVERAQRNISLNELNHRIKIVKADIKNIHHIFLPGETDMVVSNPPFWKKGEGKINKNNEEALAKHELNITLQQIVSAAGYLLHPGGRFNMIHRADRLKEIIKYLEENELNLIKTRYVHAFKEKEANLVLVEAQKGVVKKAVKLPPLIIYERRGVYSKEIDEIYSGT